jgi:lipid-A-disaccharide synthase
MAAASSRKLGIIAGSGALPGLLIAASRAAGRPYFVLGLTGFAEPRALNQEPDAWLRLGEAGRALDLLKTAGVGEVVMAGAVKRPKLADLRPDARGAQFLARIAGRALGDDGLLAAIVAEVEREGFRVVGADAILADLLAPLGPLGAHRPDDAALADIAIGVAAAAELGRRDIGQAVVVRNREVLGEEDAVGTDALLARCVARLKAGGGGVLVKVKKPQQERRVDLPTIGVETVGNAAAVGLRGIAVEAGQSLIIDRPAVVAAADAAGLFVVGVTSSEPATRLHPLVYIVACEPSGDQLSALLIRALREETGGAIRLAGIGGPAMAETGVRSLFDPADIALLGILEVVPKAMLVLRRVAETVADIEARRPDLLVTIDSWGFAARVHARLAKRNSTVTRVGYVAPQVWAWRPGRAKKLARSIHHLMALLPFEPPYFTKSGLPTSWVGHPVLESGADRGDGVGFRVRHGIGEEEPVLLVLLGSRTSEVTQLHGVFGEVVHALAAKMPSLRVVVPTVPGVEARVRTAVADWPGRAIVVTTTAERFDAFAAANAALAASGTASLELALAGVPHVIAYRVNPLSAFAVRLLIKIKYVNLVNLLLDREAVPERLQEACRADLLTEDMMRLLNDEGSRARQRGDFREALSKLSPQGMSPSHQAARTVLGLLEPR